MQSRKIWWVTQGEDEQSKRLVQRERNKKVYASHQWKRARRIALMNSPLCSCGAPACDVHHIIKLKDDSTLAFDLDNLLPVCKECHKALDTQPNRNNFNNIDFDDFN
jgi:5-methylcytosine-specific restriction endonuclease McrA